MRGGTLGETTMSQGVAEPSDYFLWPVAHGVLKNLYYGIVYSTAKHGLAAGKKVAGLPPFSDSSSTAGQTKQASVRGTQIDF